MKVLDAGLEGCLILEPRVFEDERGYFYETFRTNVFSERGLDVAFKQGNVSKSLKGVLRGLHYQWPKPQGKLVSVLEGEVWDVAVDIRRGSPTFGQWEGVILSEANKRQFWIPEGFAHGFAVLSDMAVFSYLCTDVYVNEADAAVRWNDPAIGVEWQVDSPLLSEKDAHAPLLADIAEDRLPVFVA